jgi:glutamate dehydrogenase
VVLRACCRYLLQTGIPFSQAYMERVAVAQAPITRLLVRLFETHFAPGIKGRERAAERIRQSILRALDKVASLDEDRILRAYLSVIRATLRTNYYQTMETGTDARGAPKPWVSFKLDPHAIPDLPLPKPRFEIFVYSPRVEGVHLRMGYVARGGIRWSDRREDFRTEVLGLMKAQNVKNTVIVPVGAKGGFYPKQLPAGGSRDDVQKEGIASYQTFIRGLLDVTDNIVNGKTVVRPESCAATATTPTWWSRPTRARPLSPTSPMPFPSSTDTGWAMPSPRAARPVTTTRAWASRRAAPGSA